MQEKFPDEILQFIILNHTLHVATISSDEPKPQIATVYYIFDGDFIYFPAPSQSVRIKNISANKNIAMVITNESSLVTLQIEGEAEIVDDVETEKDIIEKYSRISNEASTLSFPPITKTKDSFRIVRCFIKWYRYSDFSGPKKFVLEDKF